MIPTVVISNLEPDPEGRIFTNDIGTWNVTRALEACAAGKHGGPWVLDVDQAMAANRNVEVDQAKVAAFLAGDSAVLTIPLLGIVEDGKLWLVDGHHRLRAMHRIGCREFACYVIEEDDGVQYRVLFNGKRQMEKP